MGGGVAHTRVRIVVWWPPRPLAREGGRVQPASLAVGRAAVLVLVGAGLEEGAVRKEDARGGGGCPHRYRR